MKIHYPIHAIVLALMPSFASAEAAFERAVPDVTADFIYAGGWSHFVGGGVALFDCNDDGLTDIFTAGGANPAGLLVNTSTPHGALRFVPHDIASMADVTGAYPIDFNADGHHDLMVLRNGQNLALLGDGTCSFTDATETLNLPTDARWSTAFSAMWETGNARPTLAIGNYVDATNPDGPFGTCDTNWLIRPDGDIYSAPLALDPGFCPLSMLFSDWTRTGEPMLRISGFRVVPFTTGTFAQRPFTGDDGRPSTGWHAEFGDVNNDGRADLFIAKGNVDQMPGMAMRDPNNLLMQQPDGTFTEAAGTAGVATPDRARGAGLADLNNDGLLDLVVVNRRAPLEIWQNTSQNVGNWIAIEPQQSGGNADAIGAFITVETPDGLQTQEHTIGGGHVSGGLTPLHFGLGAHETATVQITWPDGTQSTLQSMTANQIVTVSKD